MTSIYGDIMPHVHGHIIDLKLGRGLFDLPKANSQLAMYALGAEEIKQEKTK